MKLVDVPDSKSGVVHPTCRFDSGHRHFLLLFLDLSESNLRFLPLEKRYLIVFLGTVAIGIFYCFFQLIWRRNPSSHLPKALSCYFEKDTIYCVIPKLNYNKLHYNLIFLQGKTTSTKLNAPISANKAIRCFNMSQKGS